MVGGDLSCSSRILIGYLSVIFVSGLPLTAVESRWRRRRDGAACSCVVFVDFVDEVFLESAVDFELYRVFARESWVEDFVIIDDSVGLVEVGIDLKGRENLYVLF